MEPLTTVPEVAKGLDFELDNGADKIATVAIEDLSDDARLYGSATWLTPATTPPQICRLVRRAVIRYMKNYEGYVQSRAGDETLVWTDLKDEAGSPFFTDREIKVLAITAKGRATTLQTAGISAWGTSANPYPVGLVPTGVGSKPFPLFASEDGPW